MKKLFLTLAMALTLSISVDALTVSAAAGKFSGTLNIADDPQSGEVLILPGTAANRLTMVLPDFTFAGVMNLGDIVVVDADMTTSGGISMTQYPVYIKALETRAYVNINNTSTISGNALSLDLTINVPDLGDIPVTFSGSKMSGNYQMPNSGFETGWTTVGSGKEPTGWHSFCSADGSLKSMVQGNVQLESSTDVRPGSTGSKSAKITSKKVIIAKANGNLTNGQIFAGSTTASNVANHNASDPSKSGYNTQFVGNPDSIVFWAKYIPASGNVTDDANTARMHTVITTNAYYQDPEDKDYSSVKVADATRNYHANASKGWQRLSTPFVYTSVSGDNAAYILVTFSTNKTAGGGNTSSSKVDQVYIDDVEMIYNHALTGFTLDGDNVTFSGNTASVNKPYSDENYEYSATVSGRKSQAFVGFDAVSNRVVIYTVAEDFAANSSDYSVYTISMQRPVVTALESVDVAPQAVKIIYNGKLYIRHGEAWYNALGVRVERPF